MVARLIYITFMKKYIIYILLFLCLPSSSFADNWANSGSYDISWYKKTQTEFQISTAKELAGMAYLVNNNYTSFEGKTIKLNADINLQGKTWTPIGVSNTLFQGTFDGNGHSINNVSITDGDSRYNRCGFWTELRNVTLQNFKITGTLSCKNNNVGFIAAKASSSVFKNITIGSDISLKKTDVSTSTGFTFKYNVGGCVGCSDKCTFQSIKNNSHIEFIFGSSSGNNCYGRIAMYAGGIVGYGDSNIYNRCQTKNNCNIGINGYVTNHSYSSPGAGCVYYGGIVGYDRGSTTSITSCLSHVVNFEGAHYNGTYDVVNFYYGGIIGIMEPYSNMTVLNNCVSITSNYSITGNSYSWVASWYHTNSCFGGITSKTPRNIKGCFSNNDVVKTVKKVSSNDIGECGSTSYSSRGMRTINFVEELNTFTQMEYEKVFWKLDANGDLVLLTGEETTGVTNTIYSNNSNDIIAIYDLNGHRIDKLQKGFNVIVYRDGKKRKYIK